MKKKIILVAAALVLTFVCLAACTNYDGTLNNINTLLKSDYSTITLNVTTETAKATLKGSYTFTFGDEQTTVKYSYDVLNSLDESGNNFDEYMQTVSGTAIVQDDGTMIKDGVEVNLPTSDINLAGLNFKEVFFTNIKASTETFEADVKNPKGFTGKMDLTCSDMHVKVSFSSDALSVITITYTSAYNADVTVTYLFVK